MTNRKVSVDLELEVALFNKSGAEAVNVLRGVKAEVKDLGDKADDTSRDMDQLAANTDVASRGVDHLGDQAREAAVDLTLLDARIRAAKSSMRDLGIEYAHGFDPQVGKKLDEERAALRKLENLRRELTVQERVRGGFGEGGRLSRILPYAVGIGAELAPSIGAVLSAAVLGGVGIGGVVGGAYLASKDPRVRAAWHELGSQLGDELTVMGQHFSEPLIGGAHDLAETWDRVAPGIDRSLLELAGHTRQLVDSGLGGFVEHLLPGLEEGLHAAGPVLDQLADELPSLGDALGDFFTSLHQAGPGTARGMHDLMMFTDKTVVGLGNTMELLTKIYNSPVGHPPILDFMDFWDRLFGHPAAVPHLQSLVPALRDVHHAVGIVQVDLVKATAGLDYFGQALEDVRDQAHGWIDAEVDVEESLDNLTESLANNGRTLDVTTKFGRDNIRALEDYERATKRAFDAKLDETHSIAAANQVWSQYRDKLHDALVEAGYTEDAIGQLIVKFLGLPPAVTIPITTPGAAQAIETARELNALYRFGSPIEVSWTATRSIVDTEHATHRAAGGPVFAGQTVRVNEQRLEYFTAPMSGWIQPLAPGAAPMPTGAGIDYAQLGAAVAAALQTAPIRGQVNMDGRPVGRLVREYLEMEALAGPRL